MTYQESLTRRDERSFGLSAWSIIGGVALAILAVSVISSIPDIKRYIKMSSM